jgi:hypothetical protein
MKPFVFALFSFLIMTSISQAVMETPGAQDSAPKVHYKSGKDVNFEELLIQGQLKRPEVSVVTGNVQGGEDGLLKLRENFLDRVATDAGEEASQ